MEAVTVDDVESDASDVDRRRLTGALGATELAINRYRLAPGERFAGLHAHADQEEVFVVIEGEATFETLTPRRDAPRTDEGIEFEAGEVTVGAGEAIRFAPGQFQSGKNDSEGEAVAYALGAPPDTEQLRVPVACSDCGYPATRPVATADGEALACPECDVETDAACSDCGSDDVLAVLDGDRPVSLCRDCGAETAAR